MLPLLLSLLSVYLFLFIMCCPFDVAHWPQIHQISCISACSFCCVNIIKMLLDTTAGKSNLWDWDSGKRVSLREKWLEVGTRGLLEAWLCSSLLPVCCRGCHWVFRELEPDNLYSSVCYTSVNILPKNKKKGKNPPFSSMSYMFLILRQRLHDFGQWENLKSQWKEKKEGDWFFVDYFSWSQAFCYIVPYLIWSCQQSWEMLY